MNVLHLGVARLPERTMRDLIRVQNCLELQSVRCVTSDPVLQAWNERTAFGRLEASRPDGARSHGRRELTVRGIRSLRHLGSIVSSL